MTDRLGRWTVALQAALVLAVAVFCIVSIVGVYQVGRQNNALLIANRRSALYVLCVLGIPPLERTVADTEACRLEFLP